MNLQRLLLFSILVLVIIVEPDIKADNTVKININKQIKLIKKGSEYNTFVFKDYVNRNNQNIGNERYLKYYIDIPRDLTFNGYKYSGKVCTYRFTDNVKYIIVEIHYNQHFGCDTLKSDLLNLEETKFIDLLPVSEKKYILLGLSFGIYTSDNYRVYFYNVQKAEKEKFTKAIQSLRRCKHCCNSKCRQYL